MVENDLTPAIIHKREEERGRQRKGVGLHFKSGGPGSLHVDVGECT